MSISASLKEWQLILERERITKYLPFLDYDLDKSIYICSDGGVGTIFECYPLTFANEKTHSAIQSAIQMLPEKCDIQFILYASPDVTSTIDEWSSFKQRQDPMSREIVSLYRAFLKNKVDSYISRSFYAPIRDIRLLITLKIGGARKQSGLADTFFDLSTIKKSIGALFGMDKNGSENIYDLTTRDNIARLLQVRERFKGALGGGNFNPREIAPNDLIEFLYPLLNPNHDFSQKPIWDGSYLNNFMFANDSSVKIGKDYLNIDGVYTKTLSTKEYPQHFHIAYTLNYIGETLQNTNHSTPFLFTLNVSKLGEKDKDSIKTRATITSGQRMPYSLFPKLKTIHKDLEYGMEKLEEGETPYYASFGVAVFGKSKEEVEKSSGEMQTFFKTLSFRLENDLYILFPNLLTLLPLGYNTQLQNFLGMERGRIIFGENVADLVPVCGDWKGVRAEVPLISPRGQLFGFDLFANNAGGYNGYCVGMTGSGKSVFLQFLAMNYYLSGDKIWIIDIGRSYERFAHIFGGQFIELSLKNPISLNPFTHIKNQDDFEEYLEFLQNLYLLMGLPKEKQLSEQLEKLIKSYLERALRESFSKKGSDSDVDSVLDELNLILEKNSDSRLDDFIKTMLPFRKSSQYGGFLNGKSSIAFNSDIVVLECDTLENIPDLLNPALMLISFQISKEIYLEEKNRNKKYRNIVIMDEAHKFLKSGHIELFVEQAYRRFRKHGASMILGTQGFEDFYGGDQVSQVGRVIIQNSYWSFFMMQKSTSIQAIKKSNYFNFGEYENRLMESVKPVDKEYGETLIVSDSVITKGRIVLDPFLQMMFFTTKELRAKIYKLVEQGHTYLEAINITQRQHPRMPISGKVALRVLTPIGGEELLEAKVTDISEGGIGFIVPREKDNLHILYIYHPKTNQKTKIDIRKKDYTDEGVKIGAQFISNKEVKGF